MNNPGSKPRFIRAPGVVARRVAGEMLLVPVSPRTLDAFSGAAELFVLNETGEHLWEWLAQPVTLDDMARNLIDEFEVDAERAHADATAFIEVMQERGLVALAEEQRLG
jgi:hypothetical protein